MSSLRAVLDQAIALHRQGRPAEAEPLYRQVLEAAPTMADIHYLLGMACLQQGKVEAAIRGLRTSVRQQPDNAEWRFNYGVALRQHGDMAAAAEQFAAAAARHAPGTTPHIAALAEQGAVLTAAGAYAEAEAVLRAARAMAPQDPAIAGNLAACLFNRVADATALDTPEAIPKLETAAELAPHRLDIAERLAVAYLHGERAAAAAEAFSAILARQPDHAAARLGLADAQVALGAFDAAVATAEPLVAAQPSWAEAHVALANGLHGQGRLEKAATALEKALALKPDLLAARINLGTIRRDMGDDDGAEACYSAALAQAPDLPPLHWQRAQARLMAGDMAAGWQEYEWRWHMPGFPLAPDVAAVPVWDGTSDPGRLLIHAEQGHGDSLQFIRYVPLLVQQGLDLLVQVQPALVRLFQESMPASVTVVPLGSPVPPDIRRRCPLMGLPCRLGTRLDSVPGTTPYLTVPPARAGFWRARLDRLPGRKVGLVWAGDARTHDPRSAAVDRRRSLALADLAVLGTVPGISFISLQKGPPASQAQGPQAPFPLVDWTGELSDFADTAALVAGLDLVIGVDTAVIHLAGALARPVWVLSRFDGCWRWLRHRADSPWYPGLRLFRQPAWGNWGPAIADLVDQLEFSFEFDVSRERQLINRQI